MLAEGKSCLMAETALSPLEGVREARKMWEGPWTASWRIASNPRPVFPGMC